MRDNDTKNLRSPSNPDQAKQAQQTNPTKPKEANLNSRGYYIDDPVQTDISYGDAMAVANAKRRHGVASNEEDLAHPSLDNSVSAVAHKRGREVNGASTVEDQQQQCKVSTAMAGKQEVTDRAKAGRQAAKRTVDNDLDIANDVNSPVPGKYLNILKTQAMLLDMYQKIIERLVQKYNFVDWLKSKLRMAHHYVATAVHHVDDYEDEMLRETRSMFSSSKISTKIEALELQLEANYHAISAQLGFLNEFKEHLQKECHKLRHNIYKIDKNYEKKFILALGESFRELNISLTPQLRADMSSHILQSLANPESNLQSLQQWHQKQDVNYVEKIRMATAANLNDQQIMQRYPVPLAAIKVLQQQGIQVSADEAVEVLNCCYNLHDEHALACRPARQQMNDGLESLREVRDLCDKTAEQKHLLFRQMNAFANEPMMRGRRSARNHLELDKLEQETRPAQVKLPGSSGSSLPNPFSTDIPKG